MAFKSNQCYIKRPCLKNEEEDRRKKKKRKKGNVLEGDRDVALLIECLLAQNTQRPCIPTKAQ